jgi:hypothetical protein
MIDTPEYHRDAAIVDRLLLADPIDLESLKPYAAKRFDSWCGEGTNGFCMCAYCQARRRLLTDKPG